MVEETLSTESRTAPGAYTFTPRIACDPAGVWHIHGFAEAKELLMEDLEQAGFGAEQIAQIGVTPVLYQRGEPHRQQRAHIAKFFSPTTTRQKHTPLMEQVADEIIADLVRAKQLDLNDLTRRMAAVVAATVVGLQPTAGLVRRLDAMLHSPQRPAGLWASLRGRWLQLEFMFRDVRPAIAARRRAPQDDVISYMLSKGQSEVAIFAECLVYGAAGMATTQEFISVVFWACMQRPELRALMLNGDQEARLEFLHEMLRLEPVVGVIKRRTPEPVTVTSAEPPVTIPAGALIDFHVYDINADARAVPHEPLRLSPHRELERGVPRSLAGFGAGLHRCAGEFIALAETDVFLRRLLALESLRVVSGPTLSRNPTVNGYELRDFIIAVE